ncbi:MAG: hypothetical protein ACI9QD_001048 [Thermoproteota archaeon]|jgi:hypothetical protein
MKNTLIIFSILLLSLQAFAQDTTSVELTAIVRNKKFKVKARKVKMPYLYNKEVLDGKYFKVVLGKSNDAIATNASEELLLKAATTYYHLNKARDYFANTLKSKYVQDMDKVIVRIDLKNQFNELGHFAHANFEPQFNNALSIPPGDGYEPRGIAPWKHEVWFRPLKKIHIKELKLKDDSLKSYTGVLKSFRSQTHMTTFQRFMSGLLNSNTPLLQGGASFSSIFRLVGASVIMEAGYQSIDLLNRLLRRKRYWLESALVPEIIYHEYAHIALSDHLKLTHSTPVNEGMADFFAASIAGSSKLATKIKKYNTFSGKKAKNKKRYQSEFETTGYANTDFVFGLFWELKKILGDKKAQSFMFKLRTKINSSASIRHQLIDGLLDSCRELCSSPSVDRIKILKMLDGKGI